jgi:hypothetical protein
MTERTTAMEKRILPRNPRWLNWLYAITHAYYWLPCCICGRKYGGHEPSGTVMHDWNGGQSCCELCAEEADKRNAEYMAANPPRPREFFLGL